MALNEPNKPSIYQIPRFTTGIGQKENPDHQKFLQNFCKKIEQNTDFEILGFDDFGNSKLGNYIKVDLQNFQEKISVLCNRFVPLLAFRKMGKTNEEFLEKTAWEQWVEPPFLVLKPNYLTIRPDADDPVAARTLQLLDRSEFAEIVYRMPETIAEIVFHDWKIG